MVPSDVLWNPDVNLSCVKHLSSLHKLTLDQLKAGLTSWSVVQGKHPLPSLIYD